MTGDAEYELIDGYGTPTHTLDFGDGVEVCAWLDPSDGSVNVSVDGATRDLFVNRDGAQVFPAPLF